MLAQSSGSWINFYRQESQVFHPSHLSQKDRSTYFYTSKWVDHCSTNLSFYNIDSSHLKKERRLDTPIYYNSMHLFIWERDTTPINAENIQNMLITSSAIM